MKIKKDNTYFTISVYVIVTVIVSFAGILTILNFHNVWDYIVNIIVTVFRLLKPVIFGIIIAYLLEPIVGFYDSKWQIGKVRNNSHSKSNRNGSSIEHLERWQMRTLPTFFAFLTLLAFLGLFILIIVMNIETTIGRFSILTIRDSINSYITYFDEMIRTVDRFTTDIGIFNERGNLINNLYLEINNFIIMLWNEVIKTIINLGKNTINILLGIVIAFYFLQDKQRLVEVVKKTIYIVLRPKFYHHIIRLGKDVDYVFAGYIRGEIIDSIIVGTLISLALTFIRMDFAIIIGIISGIFNLIPYFGPIVGFALAIVIGILDPTPVKAIYGGVAILIIQQIDGCYIVPKIIGEYVKLHPVVVLLAILIGGNLFGFVGMLVGVPVIALIRRVFSRYIRLYSSRENNN